MGVFFVKKWTFPQRRVHYIQYQYFFILHFTYFEGRGAYAPDAPAAYGPVALITSRTSRTTIGARAFSILLWLQSGTACRKQYVLRHL